MNLPEKLLLIAVVWTALSVPVGLLIGRVIRLCGRP